MHSAPTFLRACVRVGGVLTGEHGVGVEKRDLMARCSPRTTWSSSSGSSAPSIWKACLTPARCIRRYIAVRNSGECTSIAANSASRHPTVLDRAGGCGKAPSPVRLGND